MNTNTNLTSVNAQASFSSNVALWSSNNLFNKNTGGTVNGSIVANWNITASNNLIIASSDGDKIRLTSAGANGSKLTHESGWTVGVNAGQPTSTSGNISLRTGTPSGYVDRLYVNSDGKVGIGTTTPSTELDVSGTINGTAFTAEDIVATGSLTGRDVGASYFLTQAGVNGAVPTMLPNEGDMTNYINGDTCIGASGGKLFVGGVPANFSVTSDCDTYLKRGLCLGSFLRFGGWGAITWMHPVQVVVGSSSSQTKSVTAYLPSIPPSSDYHGIITYRQDGYNDIFCGKIDNRANDSFTLHTTRVGASSWGQSVTANILMFSF
jgi:hypothetical protein